MCLSLNDVFHAKTSIITSKFPFPISASDTMLKNPVLDIFVLNVKLNLVFGLKWKYFIIYYLGLKNHQDYLF